MLQWLGLGAFIAMGWGLIPGHGTKILQAVWLNRKKKKRKANTSDRYIKWRLEETQTEIKISRRNINNLRYADDTTLMAESEEELKSLLMKVKVESEKVG